MSQRNPMNERYQSDKRQGTTRKSAASAKPKSKAAASVTYSAPKKDPKTKKAELKAQRKAETDRQREIDRKYSTPDTARYRKLRRIFWAAMVGAIACVAASWMLRAYQTRMLAKEVEEQKQKEKAERAARAQQGKGKGKGAKAAAVQGDSAADDADGASRAADEASAPKKKFGGLFSRKNETATQE